MEYDDPRRELARVHGSMFLSQAPSNRCVICLTELQEAGHNEGLVCSKECNDLVSRALGLCSRIGKNISYAFDEVAGQIKTRSDRIAH